MTTVEISAAGITTLIPIAQLHLAEDNVRRQLGDVDELAASIKTAGLLEPLVVTPREEGGYLVVCGARRLAGAAKAGVERVPATVREFSEAERVEAMTIENLQRENLTVLEEAEAYRRLTDEFGLSQRELAKRVGRTQGHVSKRLALLELPEAAQQAVDSGRITLEDAQLLSKLRDHPDRIERLVKGGRVDSYAIDRELSDLAYQRKVAAAKAKAEKAGHAFLGVASRWALPDGAGAVAPDDEIGYVAVVMDPAEHAKLACHAVALDPYSLKPMPACLDPAGHPKTERPKQQPATRTEFKPPKEQRDYEAARERRLAFAGELVRGKVSKDDALELALPAIIGGEAWESLELTCKLLALEPPAAEADEEPDATADVDEEALETLLTAYAAESQLNRLRATLAAAIAVTEILMSWYSHPWPAWASAYIALLERHGYQPSKVERAKL
jgi:ParB/RepB/Spo0J family partition protein